MQEVGISEVREKIKKKIEEYKFLEEQDTHIPDALAGIVCGLYLALGVIEGNL